MGYTQDWHSQQWTTDRYREIEVRQMGDGIPEITGIRRNSQWDFPRRRALFASDGIYSGSSESDTSEGHVHRPPEGQYETGRGTEERHDEDGVEELGFPHKTLERAVTKLQRELDDCRTEFEITRRLTPAPAVNHRQPKQARFTSNRFLRTPRASRPVPLVRQAALTTKVPWFNGSTSWEQYLQVFDAIVLSNGWGDATAALQLLSHLQDDASSVALLIPMPLQASRKELTDALSSHYGSPGRLANYRREFDKTVRKRGEDPSNFAITLETLAVKAFGNMGQTACLRLIRDRFIAGHENCDLRRYLDCVPPDTPLRDIVDRCRVWESHGTTETRRVSKPMPEPVYPTYVVEQPDYESEPVCVVSVNKQNSQVDQTEELLKKLLEALTPAALLR